MHKHFLSTVAAGVFLLAGPLGAATVFDSGSTETVSTDIGGRATVSNSTTLIVETGGVIVAPSSASGQNGVTAGATETVNVTGGQVTGGIDTGGAGYGGDAISSAGTVSVSGGSVTGGNKNAGGSGVGGRGINMLGGVLDVSGGFVTGGKRVGGSGIGGNGIQLNSGASASISGGVVKGGTGGGLGYALSLRSGTTATMTGGSLVSARNRASDTAVSLAAGSILNLHGGTITGRISMLDATLNIFGNGLAYEDSASPLFKVVTGFYGDGNPLRLVMYVGSGSGSVINFYAPPVPLPASFPMLLIGLGLLGQAGRIGQRRMIRARAA